MAEIGQDNWCRIPGSQTNALPNAPSLN